MLRDFAELIAEADLTFTDASCAKGFEIKDLNLTLQNLTGLFCVYDIVIC